MLKVNAKTPMKRKSTENATPTPKKLKQNENSPASKKTTPGKTPKATPGKNPGQQRGSKQTPKNPKNTPKGSSAPFVRTPKLTPGKKQGQKRPEKTSESENDGSPKKLNMFSGTSELGTAKGNVSNEEKKKQKRTSVNFSMIKQKVNSGDKEVIKSIEEKLKKFEGRKELTKSAKRKLKTLLKLKRVVLGEPKPAPPTASQNRRERKKNAKAKSTGDKQNKPTKGNQKKTEVVKKQIKAVQEDDDEESSDDEIETEIQPGKIIQTKETVEEEESGEEEEDSGEEEEVSGEEEEESGEEEEASGEEEEVSGEEDDNEEAEDEESSDEDESTEVGKRVKVNGKKQQAPDVPTSKERDIIDKKLSRYVLFVGNIPFDTTKEDLIEHFKKAGKIKDIRIILDKQTNKPRGFGYVEFTDETSYQKGLSLHHTSIKGRRINVLYTKGGKKAGEAKKNEIKAKNFKLQAMRKQGQLKGSVKENQKRSFRRANAKKNGPNS